MESNGIMGDRTTQNGVWKILVVHLAGLLLWGCAHNQPLPRESYQLVYKADLPATEPIGRWAPAFVVYGHSQSYNRIGRPSVEIDKHGRQTVVMDPDVPVAYVMERTFKTRKSTYTNFIYRVHFPKIPFSLIPFYLTAGKNAGLMVVVTLNARKQPVLVTTVHTCGCYKSFTPTQYLPRDAWPDNWSAGRQTVYGENLPAFLEFRSAGASLLMVHLRPGVHRVMDIEVRDANVISGPGYRVEPMALKPVAELERLPADGETTSLYHQGGILEGHVKGAVKPFETLFLSVISMDLFVGTDKIYGDAAETGNTFYTSLKPWRRNESDMWNFATFLAYWGWRL